jgi:uncharacterized membrane protein YfcA
MLALAAVLGVAAGALTTLTGFGGGMMLIVGLALLWDPLSALTVTSLALLMGNGHRLWMYRDHVVGIVARPLLVGAVPAAFVGALVAVGLPPLLIQLCIIVMTSLALARAVFGWTWTPSPRALIPSGMLIGLITATAGGAGVLLGPLMLSAGLRNSSYLATMSLAAVSLHLGRLAGYGAGGLLGARTMLIAVALAVTLVIGNLIGRWLRERLSRRIVHRLELAMPIVCATLALLGV